MSDCVVNVPEQSVINAIENNANFEAQQSADDKRHTDLMCAISDIISRLDTLLVYMQIMFDQEIKIDD